VNLLTVLGLVLIALGVVGLIYGGITYTATDKLIDVGDVHVNVNHEKKMPISPIAGAAAVAVGAVLLIMGRRRNAGRISL
jgi:uncharacterized membrane protein YidH (DUF202 family)